jgi:hypothetical protein
MWRILRVSDAVDKVKVKGELKIEDLRLKIHWRLRDLRFIEDWCIGID